MTPEQLADALKPGDFAELAQASSTHFLKARPAATAQTPAAIPDPEQVQ